MWKVCASCLFGREASIRANLTLVSNQNCATFIRTKKDSLYKTVCVNIVLVYCLRGFPYSFPRFRRLSCVPIYALPVPRSPPFYIYSPVMAIVSFPVCVVSVTRPVLRSGVVYGSSDTRASAAHAALLSGRLLCGSCRQ